MQRAQDGDQAAYARLLKAMLPAIRAMVRKRIADESLAEDITQEVLLAIHRVRHTYDPARPILPWMGAITSARAIDALRRQGRRARRETQDETAMMVQADPHAERKMEGFAIERELDTLLAKLPARQREAVELVRLREMSLAEAAATSSLSISAIKALLHRAFITLRQNGIRDHDGS